MAAECWRQPEDWCLPETARGTWWRMMRRPESRIWNTRIGNVTNPPQTYMLDGHQYVIAATGDMLWSFMLY